MPRPKRAPLSRPAAGDWYLFPYDEGEGNA